MGEINVGQVALAFLVGFPVGAVSGAALYYGLRRFAPGWHQRLLRALGLRLARR